MLWVSSFSIKKLDLTYGHLFKRFGFLKYGSKIVETPLIFPGRSCSKIIGPLISTKDSMIKMFSINFKPIDRPMEHRDTRSREKSVLDIGTFKNFSSRFWLYSKMDQFWVWDGFKVDQFFKMSFEHEKFPKNSAKKFFEIQQFKMLTRWGIR